MTAILPPVNATPRLAPAKIGTCCRAFLQIMAGDSSGTETAADSLKFANWMLALATTLCAAGVLGNVAFAFATSKQITKIETRQEDFLNRIAVAMKETETIKQDQEEIRDEMSKIKQQVGTIRMVMQIRGLPPQ